MKTRLCLLAASLALLTCCTVTETLALSGEGGSSAADIHVEPFFVDVLYDFAEFLPEEGVNLMDASLDGFIEDLEERQAVNSPGYVKTGENDYVLTFNYSSLSQFAAAYKLDGQTLLAQENNSFSFYLDIDNYGELKRIVSFLRDPNFEVYGPEYNQGMSEEDYLDMIYFLLGEEGPDAISTGQVTIIIEVPGTVTETVNAEQLGPSAVKASFPLIDFLLLNEPISFSAKWN